MIKPRVFSEIINLAVKLILEHNLAICKRSKKLNFNFSFYKKQKQFLSHIPANEKKVFFLLSLSGFDGNEHRKAIILQRCH